MLGIPVDVLHIAVALTRGAQATVVAARLSTRMCQCVVRSRRLGWLAHPDVDWWCTSPAISSSDQRCCGRRRR